MWECTYWNNLKISRCNERSSGRAREREREKVIIVWKEQEEEENRSNIMVFAMYNFANICLPFLLLQLLEQALRCWPTTCRKKIGFICILRMRSKSRSIRCSICIGFICILRMRSKSWSIRCSTCRKKIGFIKTTFSILIKHAVLSLSFSLWIYPS